MEDDGRSFQVTGPARVMSPFIVRRCRKSKAPLPPLRGRVGVRGHLGAACHKGTGK